MYPISVGYSSVVGIPICRADMAPEQPSSNRGFSLDERRAIQSGTKMSSSTGTPAGAVLMAPIDSLAIDLLS
jgi:hypothetical protein